MAISETSEQRMGLIVVVGRIGLLGLWFAATLLIARTLGQSPFGLAEFGKYVWCTALIKLFSSFINNTVDLAVLRRAPLLLVEDRPLGIGLCRASLWIRTAAAGAIALALVLLALSPLAPHLFGSAITSSLIIITSLGIIGDVLIRAVMVYFQSACNFGRFLLIEGSLQVCRFAAVIALVLTGTLTAWSALATYVALSFGCVALGLALLPRDAYRRAPSGRHEVAAALRFSAWMIVALGVAALSERLDLFLVGYFLTPVSVAIYGAALILATIPEFLEGALNTVLMPKVSATQRKGGFRELHATYMRFAAIPCILIAIGVYLLGGWFTVTFLSAKFVAAIPVFQLQILGAVVWLAIAPIPSALVAFVSPKNMLRINAAGLTSRVIVSCALIPRFGVIGAAVTFLAMKIGMTIAVTATAYYWQQTHHAAPPASSRHAGAAESLLVATRGEP